MLIQPGLTSPFNNSQILLVVEFTFVYGQKNGYLPPLVNTRSPHIPRGTIPPTILTVKVSKTPSSTRTSTITGTFTNELKANYDIVSCAGCYHPHVKTSKTSNVN
ncbi:hypothetical protein ABEB36_002747 [Hypothenemus hampei]|uniref:Uncharacterized protein n=1 Tax=Hypothenemus hampei TaxID=57062 RepID=A0ABD1F6Y5_HYPHA